jgi:hypothetical protein
VSVPTTQALAATLLRSDDGIAPTMRQSAAGR